MSDVGGWGGPLSGRKIILSSLSRVLGGGGGGGGGGDGVLGGTRVECTVLDRGGG